MGIGYLEDFVVSVVLGVDMFDCVWFICIVWFGNVIIKYGVFNMKRELYVVDFGFIEEGCGC